MIPHHFVIGSWGCWPSQSVKKYAWDERVNGVGVVDSTVTSLLHGEKMTKIKNTETLLMYMEYSSLNLGLNQCSSTSASVQSLKLVVYLEIGLYQRRSITAWKLCILQMKSGI